MAETAQFPDPSREGRPVLDHLVSIAVEKALLWLGRRAIRRGDHHDADHCIAALRGGACGTACSSSERGDA